MSQKIIAKIGTGPQFKNTPVVFEFSINGDQLDILHLKSKYICSPESILELDKVVKLKFKFKKKNQLSEIIKTNEFIEEAYQSLIIKNIGDIIIDLNQSGFYFKLLDLGQLVMSDKGVIQLWDRSHLFSDPNLERSQKLLFANILNQISRIDSNDHSNICVSNNYKEFLNLLKSQINSQNTFKEVFKQLKLTKFLWRQKNILLDLIESSVSDLMLNSTSNEFSNKNSKTSENPTTKTVASAGPVSSSNSGDHVMPVMSHIGKNKSNTTTVIASVFENHISKYNNSKDFKVANTLVIIQNYLIELENKNKNTSIDFIKKTIKNLN